MNWHMYIFFCLLSVETNQGICNSVTRYRKLLRSKETLLQPEFYELTARRRFWKELCSHYIHFSFSLMAKNQNSEVGVARQQDLVLCPSNSKQEDPQLLFTNKQIKLEEGFCVWQLNRIIPQAEQQVTLQSLPGSVLLWLLCLFAGSGI